MPGAVLRLLYDRVVNDFQERNQISVDWNIYNEGQGVVVRNAFKDHPGVGLGDPTVGTFGSNAYYKWVGTNFIKISEGEGLDLDLNIVEYDAAPAIIVLPFDYKREQVFKPNGVTINEAKEWQFENAMNAVRFGLFFEIGGTGDYAQQFPANTKMNSIRFDQVTKIWTPPEAGEYKCRALFDTVNWWLHIEGPIVP